MARIVVTDSTSYLPLDIIQKYKIKIVPLNVHIPGLDFKEGEHYSNREYYKLLEDGKFFPTTSQPAAGDFLKVFEQLEDGDEALVILLSSKLSGTFQSALMAREMLAEEQRTQIHIFDSESGALGLGFQVIHACERIEDGIPTEQIWRELGQIRSKMQIYFIVNNLEYLVRGGRLNKLSGAIGNILQLKPILYVKDGELALYEKVRTLPKAMKRIQDELDENRDSLSKIAVVQVNALETANELQKELSHRYGVPVVICEPGPVIGSHIGPGALGLIYY